MTDAWNGVPENPERDGWHWLKIICGISAPRPRLWWSGMNRWELSDGTLIYAGECAERWHYHGPCATPAEVAALRERAEKAEAEAKAAREKALREALDVASAYANAGRRKTLARARHARSIAAAIRALIEKEKPDA